MAGAVRGTRGAWGEDYAAAYLRRHGYRILTRNYSCRFGEIDIIASDRHYVVFVEVKLRASDRFVRAGAYVTPAKQTRIRTAASLWLAEHETPLQPLLDAFGYKDMERCLFLGFTDGEKGYSRNVARNIARIARKHGGMPLTGYVTRSWEKGRFNDPYLRDTLMDFGITTDTLECTVNWSNMEQVHADVRKICHALPNTVVTTHMSHCYPQGANLYFIFLTRMQDEDAFKAYHTTILDAIQRSGAAVSHHHGIGKMFAPWLEGYIGEKEYGVFRVLKNYFDPDYNMNPGGTIGLDLKPEEKKFLREYTDYLEQPKFD